MKRLCLGISILTIVGAAIAPVTLFGQSKEGTEGRAPEQLGQVVFPNSCSAAVQGTFIRGVALLHSFWYSEAEKTFREVLAQDSTCAIANWGIATARMNNPIQGVGALPKDAEVAHAAIAQGRQMGAKTQRERDFIEAVAVYFEDSSNRPERLRQQNRAKAYEQLAGRYASDDEAQVFYAVYLAATQSLSDQSYAPTLKAAQILEAQFAKHPDHPGVAHYLIHSYDYSPIAGKGVPAARRYADIAPAAPHALHMPSHIFTRVGAWEDSAATNSRAARTAVRGGESDEALHSMDYMVYAYLQLARDHDADKIIGGMRSITGATRMAAPYALNAMPARYVIERGAWKEAAQLQPTASSYPPTEALTYFARALGAARGGDPASADKDVQRLVQIRDALKAAKNEYWATEVEVCRLGAEAWIALARGNSDQALGLMNAAADMEDKSEKNIITPGRIVPARELLGDLLLDLKRPGEALKAYESSQVREPNRFRGLSGAAQAAAASGDSAKAKRYYARLVELAGAGDPRPEVARARAFVAQN